MQKLHNEPRLAMNRNKGNAQVHFCSPVYRQGHSCVPRVLSSLALYKGNLNITWTIVGLGEGWSYGQRLGVRVRI